MTCTLTSGKHVDIGCCDDWWRRFVYPENWSFCQNAWHPQTGLTINYPLAVREKSCMVDVYSGTRDQSLVWLSSLSSHDEHFSENRQVSRARFCRRVLIIIKTQLLISLVNRGKKKFTDNPKTQQSSFSQQRRKKNLWTRMFPQQTTLPKRIGNRQWIFLHSYDSSDKRLAKMASASVWRRLAYS